MKIDYPKPEEIKDERYFEIRDVDRDGCGTFLSFCVTADTPDEEIFDIAAELWTERMQEREASPFRRINLFFQPPYWRPTLKVVEMKRTAEKLPEPDERGKEYRQHWDTKRKGLKFTIVNRFVRLKYADGTVYEGNGYRFGKIINLPQQEKPNETKNS